MTASPVEPAEPVCSCAGGLGGECGEQVLDLVAGQWDQVIGGGCVSAFVGGGRGQEGVGEHGEGDPAQRLTWCSSSPARPLPDWKVSSTVHLRPGTFTRVDSGTRVAE